MKFLVQFPLSNVFAEAEAVFLNRRYGLTDHAFFQRFISKANYIIYFMSGNHFQKSGSASAKICIWSVYMPNYRFLGCQLWPEYGFPCQNKAFEKNAPKGKVGHLLDLGKNICFSVY